MVRKGICTLLVVAVLMGTCWAAPEVQAPSCILVDKTTGTVLYEQDADHQLAPASVTKVMTLLLVMEAIDRGQLAWEDTVTASAQAAAKGGSQVYLEENEQMSVREMVKCVVVASANDCATALAEAVAGSESSFVEQMNQRAAELGMTNTHFANCTGLDDEAGADVHYTTARDIAIMSRELLSHDAIREFTTIWMDTIRDGTFGLSNTNKLVRFYPGTTGLKTGFTTAAGYCMSASAEKDGMELIAVVMQCASSTDRFNSAKALLEYGFANYTLVDPLGDIQLQGVQVDLGTQDQVQPVVQDTQPVLLEKAQAAGITREVTMADTVSAPVEAGQTLGTLTLRSGETVLAEIPLVAEAAVMRLSWGQLLGALVQRLWMGA
jgi:D-alanyl-D-alanine carboxypeptidase (penicillin-binding protein 5/6)